MLVISSDGFTVPDITWYAPIASRAIRGTINVMIIKPFLFNVVRNSWRNTNCVLFMVVPRHLEEYFVQGRGGYFKTVDGDAAAYQALQELMGRCLIVQNKLDITFMLAFFSHSRHFPQIPFIAQQDSIISISRLAFRPVSVKARFPFVYHQDAVA